MTKIAIHGRAISGDSVGSVKKLLKMLHDKGVEVHISTALQHANVESINLNDYAVYEPNHKMKKYDMVMSLGGDGTLLETLTHVGEAEVPILGINTGRLGFLATISKDRIEEAMNLFFNGEYEYDSRTLLKLESEDNLFPGQNFALNEFSILRKDTSAMIVIKCYLNGEFLNTYWADGLMVSTPTGSTGYSLSCGGPVIMPDTKNFIITPVSAHNLNVRPLIISELSKLTFSIESRDQSFLVSLDSRAQSIDNTLNLSVSKADFSAKLVRVKGISFLDTLRTKLTWGLDKRN